MIGIAMALVLFLGGSASAFAGPVHDAARDGDSEKLSRLIAEGAELNRPGDDGETPLILAILQGHAATIELLVEQGADIHARNDGGFTPLHAAAYVGDVATAEQLLARGVNIDDQQNKAGVSALSVAAEQGQVAVARILVEQGANLEAGEVNGYTPLSRALWRQQEEVVSLLQQAGAACQPVEILGKPYHDRCVAGTP
jgi:ankyrin repeat protein